jgi:hypothetical protein
MKKVKVVNARSWYICHEGEIFDVLIENEDKYFVSYRSGQRSIPKCDCEELNFCDRVRHEMLFTPLRDDAHYDNSNGSLYKFAEDQSLNAWEFDIIKRVVRCRSKGQFVSDLEKTKRVIDLYLKEYGL